MKARHICAVAGVALAVGLVVFMHSLAKSNDHQGLTFARQMLSALPIEAGAKVTMLAPDYRPDGRPLQGPPLRAVVATRTDASVPDGGILVSKALFAQRKMVPPAVGTELTFTGRQGAYVLKVSGVLDWDRPVRGYPNAYVSEKTAADIAETWNGWEPKTAEELAPGFTGDDGRNLGRVQPLLLWAAFLTALALIVNSVFLSLEAKRRDLAILRVLGLTRAGVMRRTAWEALTLALAGAAVGSLLAVLCTKGYVAYERTLFPVGPAYAWRSVGMAFVCAPLAAIVATVLTLRASLSVKPLEAVSSRLPRKRLFGTLVAFAVGFGAFVAVEVWGASLMRSFVPSTEWPDAIVSILPAGVSSFEIENLQGKLPGVRRIHELAPLQLDILPKEELKGPQGPGLRGPNYRNALLLASDWLPEFKFVAGDRKSAEEALKAGDNCVITEMMARARNLKMGDGIRLDCQHGLTNTLTVVGIVDLNWHLVTSRGLVRGLNRKPVNTDGPLFVSFDTLDACDPRPSVVVNMTHLWLDYEPEFLASNGVFAAGRSVEKEIVAALGGADLLSEDGEVRGNNVQLHMRDEVSDGTLARGDEMIGSMARIPYVFLAVITLGFMAMLVASADGRKKQFAILRAIGATRFQLARILIREALRVAVGGLVVGGLVGAAAGWLFTSVTRAAMANWGLPPAFSVPWVPIAEGAAGAILLVLLVAVPTSLVLIGRVTRR